MANWLNFVKAHERIFLAIIAGCVLYFSVNKFLDYWHDRELKKLGAQSQQLEDQVQKNQELANQLKTDTQNYQKLASQLAVQNAAILSAIAARDKATESQIHTDANLNLTDLASRWQVLIKNPGVAPQFNTLSVSEQAGHETVAQLEEVAPLKENIIDQQTEITNKDKQIGQLQTVQNECTAQVAGLQAEVQDQQKSCASQISVVKTEARRSKMKWGVIGILVGLALKAAL